MLGFLRKHKNKIILPLLLLAYGSFFLLNSTNAYFMAVNIIAPVQEIITNTINDIKGFWNNYILLINTEKDNIALRKNLKETGRLKSSIKELARENKRLKDFLSFKEKEGIKCSGASVIFRGALSKSNTIFINKGKEDGIEKNMVIVVPEGIVGKIAKVSKTISMAYLLTHPGSAVDAVVQRTRDRCVFQGGTPCRLKYLDYNADVKAGDLIISSGLGGIFPAGLPLGRVIKVAKDSSGFFLNANVFPVADVLHMEEVLVLENPYHLEIEMLKKETP